MIVVLSSILCGILGRMGGSGNYPRQARVIGIPILTALLAFYFSHNFWAFAIIPLMIGAISTYHDYLGEDNFYLHGAVIALSLFPLAFPNHWIGFAGVMILYTLWMGLWSKFTKWDVLEEFGRYFIIPVGVYLLK